MDHFLFPPLCDSKKADVLNDEEFSEDWKIPADANVQGHNFVDSFRHFHPDREHAFTCWNTMKNCRSTNFGTRLDYILVCKSMLEFVDSSNIDPDFPGSDHCPAKAVFAKFDGVPAKKCPSFCTRYFPEFSGSQQKLSSYFSTGQKRKIPQEENASAVPPKVSKAPKTAQTNITSFFAKPIPSKSTETILTPKQISGLQSENCGSIEKREKTANAWKSLMKGPPQAPLCPGHKEVSVLRTVKKKGPNSGRQFWCCARGEGKVGDPKARCDFFKWVK